MIYLNRDKYHRARVLAGGDEKKLHEEYLKLGGAVSEDAPGVKGVYVKDEEVKKPKKVKSTNVRKTTPKPKKKTARKKV